MRNREPDLRLGGFSLWVHRWERPDSQDYSDGNWLVVTAMYRSAGASVIVEGPILHSPDVSRFRNQCEALYEFLRGSAQFDSLDAGFKIVLSSNDYGRIGMAVDITPDIVDEQHRFLSEIDQSYLPDVIKGLNTILQSFAPRGRPET
jgi:hypothetical protein